MHPSNNEQWFINEVLQSPVPVLFHFCAPWCDLCRAIEPVLQHYVGESDIELNLVTINTDDHPKLANNYQIKILPTVLLFAEGKVLYRMDEIESRDQMASMLTILIPWALEEADRGHDLSED